MGNDTFPVQPSDIKNMWVPSPKKKKTRPRPTLSQEQKDQIRTEFKAGAKATHLAWKWGVDIVAIDELVQRKRKK